MFKSVLASRDTEPLCVGFQNISNKGVEHSEDVSVPFPNTERTH